MLRDLVLLRGYDRQWVEFDDIAPVLVQSVMMSEDGQFCAHAGIDWAQMRVSSRTRSTANRRARQHDPDADGQEPVPLERPLLRAQGDGTARWRSQPDFVWSKRRPDGDLPERREWGEGHLRDRGAARHHFGVSAAKLSARQAALLAVSLPNPIDRNAGKPGRGLRRLAGVIERRASRSGGYITCLYE